MHIIQKKILDLSRQTDISIIGYRKIGQMIGIAHPQQIKHHLAQLMKKGHIKPDKSANLVETIKNTNLLQPRFIEIPIYGSANCGPASLLAEDRIEGKLQISESLLKKKKVIALHAVGDSMNDADVFGENIEEGDFVLVDTNNKQPANGQYVLSIIDNCANIKKFYKKNNDQILLISESKLQKQYKPIYISSKEDYLIGGVVTQVLKHTIK